MTNNEQRVTRQRQICVIPGDGIGHEVIPAAVDVLQATGLPLTFVTTEAGWDVFQRIGTALPPETLATVRASDAVLFGAVSSPSHRVPGYRSPIVQLRRALDLYANLRPVQSPRPSHANANHQSSGLGAWNLVVGSLGLGFRTCDLLIVRENSEGLYSGRERVEARGDVVIAERVISRWGVERIARVALEQARRRRRQLTIVHKANVLRESDGLFRQVVLDMARGYPDVRVEEQLVDSMAYRLIRDPEVFDVIVTPNLYGDILSDEAAALAGGLGLVASANVGDATRPVGIFEPVHGSAPDIAGQGIANPLGAVQAAAMLLDALSEQAMARRIRCAVDTVLRNGPYTPDLGGQATTSEVTQAVIAALVPEQ
ncbi:MAG TPA: isocitrate/isopropylmalate dehydrogenase family protein [Anaerolineae bacterium]|nr:isocitrate/isopropylmalate dehydrogenase family protein [Anaerolineae bacterium]